MEYSEEHLNIKDTKEIRISTVRDEWDIEIYVQGTLCIKQRGQRTDSSIC